MIFNPIPSCRNTTIHSSCCFKFFSYSYDPYFAVIRQNAFYTVNVGLRILCRWAVSYVDGELKHCESVFKQLLPEVACGLALALRVGGQVEKDENPHNTVFAETIHHCISGYASLRLSPEKQRASDAVV